MISKVHLVLNIFEDFRPARSVLTNATSPELLPHGNVQATTVYESCQIASIEGRKFAEMGSLFVKSVIFRHIEYTVVSLFESILLLRKQCKLSSGRDAIFAAVFENTHNASVE